MSHYNIHNLEYEYRFNTITAKYFFGDLAAYRRLKDVAYRCPSLDTCFLLDEVAREHLVSTLRVVHYKDLLARTPQGGAYEAYRGRSDATAAIYFTSGTTGNPKPVGMTSI